MMSSQTNPDGAPEENAPRETSSQETSSQEIALEGNASRRFGPSRFEHREFSLLSAALVAFLLALGAKYTGMVVGWEAPGAWTDLGLELALDAGMVAGLVLVVLNSSRKEVLVGENEIRKVQPLWRDQSVPTSEIRRVHVPTTQDGLWLYTDTDGKPALKIGARLEDSEELEEMVTESIPSDAEITGHREERH
ncbi:hypothetical protein GGP94_002992 [Salinibacter ruber]|uniref:hypothetical protein n=2 Tax=Salinibacter ruber TaxID=146919 RepID=UPI00216770FB|nr:hypothetical protein [Salinibacter ruber]MCS4162548.1 hypothetical protein [Salinibacter ruber]